MISRIRAQLGHAGFVVAIVALVAALAGGAYAASGGGLTGKQKKEVEKIAKKFAGKQGPAGQSGAPGANGKDGTNGTNGTNGKDGNNGAAGKSVTLGTVTAGATCAEGGTSVEVEGTPASKKSVCNGAEGPEGSPWTAGGTLPSEATETGSFRFVSNGEVAQYLAVSFPIPLAGPDAAGVTYEFVKEGATNTNCPGTALEPKAESGFFCVYGSGAGGGDINWANSGGRPSISLTPDFSAEGVGPSGAVLSWEEAAAGAFVNSTFAVTP